MVKTDVEAAIHGKQWPLSCYGPFKDKRSIPNFIEDQSFEEVRMLCYETKQKNFFDQFNQQFTKEVLEAGNKMNALLQMTPEVVEVLVNVYDSSSDTSGFGAVAGKSTNNTSNPFGLGNTGSIFNKSLTNTSSNNLFANNKTTFATPNPAASGLFSNTSVFAQQQPTSVFAQAPKPTNSIFAVGTNTNAQQTASIFAQPQNSSNIFTTTSQQQQPNNANGLFSQQNQFMQQTQQNTNIFRQAMQSSQPQQGLFAQASQAMQQQQQQVQPQQNLFSMPAQQQQTGQNIFASSTQQTQNIFAQAVQQQQQQQQQISSNIFQQNQPNTASQQQPNTNLFQQNQPLSNPQQIQTQQPAAGTFQQIPMQMQNTAGQTDNNSLQPTSPLYSRLEDLTAEEMEAFKADCFVPGKIPFNPPPRELIN